MVDTHEISCSAVKAKAAIVTMREKFARYCISNTPTPSCSRIPTHDRCVAIANAASVEIDRH
jgi:hypothetical protein